MIEADGLKGNLGMVVRGVYSNGGMYMYSCTYMNNHVHTIMNM